MLAAGASAGGVADVFRRVLRELSERGHGVEVVRFPVRRTAAGSAIATLRAVRRSFRSARTVHLEFGSNDLEAFWFALLAVLVRRDCVVVAHDYPKLANAPAAGLVPTSTRLGRAVAYRVLCPLLDRVVVDTIVRRAGVLVVFGEDAAEGWLSRGARCVEVIRHGADTAAGDHGVPPSRGESVLFAGFLGPSKGIDTLLEAWAQVGEHARLPLVLAGEPHDPWFFETAARYGELRNPPRVLGPIPSETEFQRLIDRAAVIVLPYRFSSPASGVLVRAMSAGRPVLTTPVPAVNGTIRDGENGVVVPIGDAGALAGELARLCRSPGERDRLGAAAAETARAMFSWERHVDGLEAAYALAGSSAVEPRVGSGSQNSAARA